MSAKEQSLVIVESPAKAKTISAILGNSYVVESSMGHVVDLPQKKLGIDIDNGFSPEFVVMPGKVTLLKKLKKEAKNKKHIYLATDPDREGEAIGWHIKAAIAHKNDSEDKFLRVVFHEITKEAVKEAFSHPQDLNQALFDSQQARRILDRVVGYFLSPFLWRKIARGLSAGRVQSVALRIIRERERQIEQFIPQEYWEIEARLSKVQQHEKESFVAKLVKIDNKDPEIATGQVAKDLVTKIEREKFSVADIEEKDKTKSPSAPFTTSSLQQEAFNRLRFTAQKTMLIAQKLYEGVELGESGPTGLITYMRTDSVNVAQSALNEVRKYITESFGKEYLPDSVRIYKSKKGSQEAHEAIRPTGVMRKPDDLKQYLATDELKLYELIWRRFVASQMKPAQIQTTTVKISAGVYLFSVSNSKVSFNGYLAIYEEKDDEENEKEEITLPPLSIGEILKLIALTPSQHFTKPPAHFSDASLVKFLEERGIGRPSTYVPIIQTLLYRDYVRRIKGYFTITELGAKVADLLIEYFKDIMDLEFSAKMEEELDLVEEGKIAWLKVLQDFYPNFKKDLDHAQNSAKKEVVQTSEVCPQCAKPMVIKWGRKGKFLSCSDYPTCKASKSISSGVKCPNPGCGGDVVERRSKKGRFFYGCSNYPKCTFVSNTLPKDA
jgi:DNA topoisomerase-1